MRLCAFAHDFRDEFFDFPFRGLLPLGVLFCLVGVWLCMAALVVSARPFLVGPRAVVHARMMIDCLYAQCFPVCSGLPLGGSVLDGNEC